MQTAPGQRASLNKRMDFQIHKQKNMTATRVTFRAGKKTAEATKVINGMAMTLLARSLPVLVQMDLAFARTKRPLVVALAIEPATSKIAGATKTNAKSKSEDTRLLPS